MSAYGDTASSDTGSVLVSLQDKDLKPFYLMYELWRLLVLHY